MAAPQEHTILVVSTQHSVQWLTVVLAMGEWSVEGGGMERKGEEEGRGRKEERREEGNGEREGSREKRREGRGEKKREGRGE